MTKTKVHLNEEKVKFPQIQIVNNQLTTTSLQVAKFFNKKHSHVMRDIEVLISQLDKKYQESNFGLLFYEVTIGNGAIRKYPMYTMTKNGFVLLAMGFTGEKAMQFKVAYIEAFDNMEAELANQAKPKRQKPLPKPKQLSITNKSSGEYQYPPHTQVLMNFTKDHNHLMHELYGLSMEICDDLAVLGRYPVCRARDRLASNPKVICFEQFTEGMIINDIRNLKKIAMNFRDEFWRLCDFYIMLSHMQGL